MMNKTKNKRELNDDHEVVEGDDAVIGRALLWSALVMMPVDLRYTGDRLRKRHGPLQSSANLRAVGRRRKGEVPRRGT